LKNRQDLKGLREKELAKQLFSAELVYAIGNPSVRQTKSTGTATRTLLISIEGASHNF
jgi:hypothetical protein